ncbi:Predicted arabinose efflux permease, MFS family [Klenkia marina]|uniref:Predicted arabinose efflux permease, MFS family n=1 Tax=Klenkia marina TaxID=1960309 RepID=A0A1G4XGK0_9ACTN|nr:MFS transporter [Klenkia marina]SCX40311.1 Predicted arabinose efflux permease, MFS family [Klenkia marina]
MSLFRGWFLAYVVGALGSGTGIWMLRLGQTLALLQVPGVAGWSVGVLAALQTVPVVLLAPVLGGVADRVPRLAVLLAGQSVMAGVAVTEVVRAVAGTPVLAHSLVLAGVLGCAAALDQPVRTSAVADLVPVADLPRGVGAVVLTTQLGRVLGPAAGALLTAVRGTAALFAGCAALFLAFAAVLLPRARRRVGSGRPRTGPGAWAALRADPALVLVLWFVGWGGLVGPNLTTLATLTVVGEFGGDALAVSGAALALAVGAVGGALWTTAGRRTPMPGTVGAGAVACGLAAAASGAAPTFPVYLGALVLCGATSVFMASQGSALVQVRVPDEVRGAVTGVFTVALVAGVPLGAPLMGLGADVLGPRVTAAVAGGLVVLAAAAALARRR